MVKVLLSFIFLILTAYVPFLFQSFFIAKIFVSVAVLIAFIFWFSRQTEIQVPVMVPWLLIWLAWTVVSVGANFFNVDIACGVIFLSGSGLFLWILNLKDGEKNSFIDGFYKLAGLTALLCWTQFLWPSFWESMGLAWVRQRPSALVGNPEFLGTFLGFALLLKHSTLSSVFESRSRKTISLWLFLLSTLVLIQSKGTLVLLGVCWLWIYRKKLNLFYITTLAASLIAIGLFSHSLRSRVLLWLVAFVTGLKKPQGVGIGEFGSHYYSSLEYLFQKSEWIRLYFGDLSGVIEDAHNLLLHQFAEMGVLGLVSGVIFVVSLGLWISRRDHKTAIIAFFILMKSLSTVFLNSPVSVVCAAASLALVFPLSHLKMLSLKKVHKLGYALAVGLVCFHSWNYFTQEINYSLGYRAIQRNDWDLGSRYFQEVLQNNSQHADAWLGLAYVAVYKNQDPEIFLTKVLQRRSDFNTLKLAAKIYLLSGDCYNASNIYKRITFTHPQHLTSMSNLAQCALKIGQKNEADYWARKILSTQVRVPTKTYGLNLLIAEGILMQNSSN